VTSRNFETDVNGSIVNAFCFVLASIRWNLFCFSQGTVATFYRCGG